MIKDIQIADCFQSGGVKLERVKYFQRQLLTVDDMVTDQEYFRQKMRRHNRFLHGWGVVCGLVVTAAPIDSAPYRVRISEGYALGPFGDDIYVGEPVFLDLGKCGPNGKTDPCFPGRATGSGIAGTVYVAIEYAECLSDPVRSMAAGCGCEDDGCQYSRIRDSFDLGCLTSMPPINPVPLVCTLERTRIAPCPPCPASPWVVLAAVTMPAAIKGVNPPAGAGTAASRQAAGTNAAVVNPAITNALVIDNTRRKMLYRTELLQQQIIACCCGEQTAPMPVQVSQSGLNPANGVTLAQAPSQLAIPFTKPLQTPVNPGSIVVSVDNRPVNLTLAYTAATHVVTLTPAAGAGFPRGAYKVTVLGSGTTPIVDTDGLILDGNYDAKPGGDFAYGFNIGTPGLIP